MADDYGGTLRERLCRWRAGSTAAGVLLAFLGGSSPVQATNDLVHIEEVLAGANGDSRVQFVRIKMESGAENCWGPQVAAGTPGADSSDDDCFAGGANETLSRAMLVFFDANGRETGRYLFPENPPGGAGHVLVATAGFAALPGNAATPDFTMPPLLNPVSGTVCYRNTQNPRSFFRNDCLSYGALTGDPRNGQFLAFGAPAPSLTITNTLSLRRSFSTGRNSDYTSTSVPTPRNFAGLTFTIPVLPLVDQGKNLFEKETFQGNGRTCFECHILNQSARLTPAGVQARFSAPLPLSDPLFIAEAAPSSFDAGLDFNLNVLELTGRPVPISGTFFGNSLGGDLRGIINGTTGRAKVLGRISPTTYVIHGGLSPMLSGTVSDGTSQATVASVTPGDLNGLESPERMRRSASPFFPDGRALILENIDGFANPPVFRKSPHLLNLLRAAPYGFSGDIPDLRTFATGAVLQHFPRTLARNTAGSNPDFRLPTSGELQALEAFMASLEFPAGTDPNKFDLSRFATSTAQRRGRDVFFGNEAKCSKCHGGTVLALTTESIQGKPIGVNASFNTGVVSQPINEPAIDNLPCEPSTAAVGPCGSREFNTPQLFNVSNLGPFFHDASAPTLLDAVQFYTSSAFLNSPAGTAIGGITMNGPQRDDLVEFLESLSTRPYTLNPTRLAFGSQNRDSGPSPTLGITIRNPNTVTAISFEAAPEECTLAGPDAGEFEIVSCPLGSPLEPGESRVILVRFDPSSLGAKSAVLDIHVAGVDSGVDVTGTGILGPSIGVSPTSRFPGQAVTVTPQNGPANAADWVGMFEVGTSTNLGWKYLNGEQTAPSIGTASASLTFNMPMRPGTYEFRFLPNNASSPVLATSLPVTVAAPTTPVLSVSPGSFDFGQVNIGAVVERTFTVQNTGVDILNVNVAPSGPGYSIVGANTLSLGAGQSGAITASFSPAGVGSASGSAAFTSNGGSHNAALNGIGKIGPACSVSPSSVFPGQPVTLTVERNEPATTTDWVGLFLDAPGSPTRDWQYMNGQQVPPGAPMSSATLTFGMPSDVGRYVFRYFANNGGVELARCGVAVADPTGPVLSLSPLDLDFGSVMLANGELRTITVTNRGIGTLNASVTIDPSDFQVIGPSALSLGAGQQGTVTVQFSPISQGESHVHARFSSNGLNGGAGTVELDGAGVQGRPGITSATSVTQGARLTVALERNGVASATDWVGLFRVGEPTNLGWRYLNGQQTPPATGIASASITFEMPTALGNYVFRYFANNGGQVLATSRVVAVVEPTDPLLCVQGDLAFGTVGIGSFLDRTVTVRNCGVGTLTGTVAAVSSGAFSLVGPDAFSLAVGESTGLTVRFAPAQAGSEVGTLDFQSNGGVATPPMTGTGALLPTIAPDVASAMPGRRVSVQVVRNGTPTTTDWVGMFRVGDPANLGWAYLNGQQSPPSSPLGSAILSFNLPLPGADYVFKYFPNNSGQPMATSAPVKVHGVAPNPATFGDVFVPDSVDRFVVVVNRGDATLDVTANIDSGGASYSIVGSNTFSLAPAQGGQIAVKFSPTGAGAAPGVLGLVTGEGDVSVPLIGTGRTNPRVLASPTTVGPAGFIDVAVQDGPANALDWVGMFEVGGSTNLGWMYLNGEQTPPAGGMSSASLTFRAPLRAGQFHFRLFLNNGSSVLTTSNPVTVEVGEQ